MLRQIIQALRYSIEDFFNVPWPAVAALLAVVILLGFGAYLRTIYGVSSHFALQMLLLLGACVGLAITKNGFKKR